MRELSGRSGSALAIDRVSCSFLLDTVTVVAGEAGAGKTTLFDLMSGQSRASAGEVRLFGRRLTQLPVALRVKRGIGRGFQVPRCFGAMSVIEHVRLAVQSRRREGLDAWTGWWSHRNTLERAHVLVDRVDLADRVDAPASSLELLDRRRLEFAMLMALEPLVYLLDEPGAGLPQADLPAVRGLIDLVALQRHKIIVIAERRAATFDGLADRIVVLRDGRIAADGPAGDILTSRIGAEAFEPGGVAG